MGEHERSPGPSDVRTVGRRLECKPCQLAGGRRGAARGRVCGRCVELRGDCLVRPSRLRGRDAVRAVSGSSALLHQLSVRVAPTCRGGRTRRSPRRATGARSGCGPAASMRTMPACSAGSNASAEATPVVGAASADASTSALRLLAREAADAQMHDSWDAGGYRRLTGCVFAAAIARARLERVEGVATPCVRGS